MKKIYSILAVLASVSFTNAQIEKKSIWLGEDFSASTNSNTNTDINGNTSSQNTNFSIAISMGEAIKQNLIVGFQLGWGGDWSQTDSLVSINTNTYSLELFARKYTNLSKRFYFFKGASADFGYTNGTSSGDVHGYDLKFSLYAGISYAASNRLYLEALIPNLLYYSYTHQKATEPGSTQKNSYFTEGSSLSDNTPLQDLSVGLQLIIGK